MQIIQHIFNIPESKHDCGTTECAYCEYMRELIMERTETYGCFNERKAKEYRHSISTGV